MAASRFKELLVVVPHSGILIPHEIPLDSISPDFSRLMRNVDWYTDWLYDFRDILNNSQVVFPYCNLILEVNRHPANIEQSVPLKDVVGDPVYRSDCEPDTKLRVDLSKKYLRPFNREISAYIRDGSVFMLDGHATVSTKGMADNQIELMSYQVDVRTGRKTWFCPDIIIETYAQALTALLPGIKITVNESRYDRVYGHVCAAHSLNAMTRKGGRVPALLQETNMKLYMNADMTCDYKAMETLRRAYAGALLRVRKKIMSAGSRR